MRVVSGSKTNWACPVKFAVPELVNLAQRGISRPHLLIAEVRIGCAANISFLGLNPKSMLGTILSITFTVY